MSTRYKPQPFRAESPCPQCGDRDFHDLDYPPEVDPDGMIPEGYDHYEEVDEVEIFGFGGRNPAKTLRHVTHHYRADKTTCDVIRVCEHCGAKWPET